MSAIIGISIFAIVVIAALVFGFFGSIFERFNVSKLTMVCDDATVIVRDYIKTINQLEGISNHHREFLFKKSGENEKLIGDSFGLRFPKILPRDFKLTYTSLPFFSVSFDKSDNLYVDPARFSLDDYERISECVVANKEKIYNFFSAHSKPSDSAYSSGLLTTVVYGTYEIFTGASPESPFRFTILGVEEETRTDDGAYVLRQRITALRVDTFTGGVYYSITGEGLGNLIGHVGEKGFVPEGKTGKEQGVQLLKEAKNKDGKTIPELYGFSL